MMEDKKGGFRCKIMRQFFILKGLEGDEAEQDRFLTMLDAYLTLSVSLDPISGEPAPAQHHSTIC